MLPIPATTFLPQLVVWPILPLVHAQVTPPPSSYCAYSPPSNQLRIPNLLWDIQAFSFYPRSTLRRSANTHMRSSAHACYDPWPQPSSPSCPSQAPTASAYTCLANRTRITWPRGSKRRTPSSFTFGMLDTGRRIHRKRGKDLHTRKAVSIPILVVDVAPHLPRQPSSESVDAGWPNSAAQPSSIVNSNWAPAPVC